MMSTWNNTHTPEKSHACYEWQLLRQSSVFIVCVADSCSMSVSAFIFGFLVGCILVGVLFVQWMVIFLLLYN